MTACKSNCKNLATALEMYSTDNKGRYSTDLNSLTRGNYLKVVPTCPSAQKDTYSGTYSFHSSPDRFTFYCQGLNHEKAFAGFPGNKENFPQYGAEAGLIDHP